MIETLTSKELFPNGEAVMDEAKVVTKKEAQLKRDKYGLPLEPQPSDHKDDPLNWQWLWKVYIALLVSGIAFTAQAGAALINPAFVTMSRELDITVEQASYCTTVFILFSGVLSMFIVPFANVYGRRICYVIFTLVGVAGAFTSAGAPSYGGIIAGRVLNGVGGSVPLGLGAASICDLFTQGKRGLYMGIYVLSVNNGPHIAPIAGGYIAERLGWRWCFWVPGIVQSALWVILSFTLPETLFSRPNANQIEHRSYIQKLLFHGKVLDRKVRPRDFVGSLRMARYLAVLFPALWFMTASTYGSAIFAVTGARQATQIYHFDVDQIGLYLGVPLTIGFSLGEASAGWVSDRIVTLDAKRNQRERKPEARLYLLPACTLLGIGTALYGYCIQKREHWIFPSVCMAVSGFGTQVGTTMVYTYATDSYKPQSGEIGAVMNLFKASEISLFTFNIGFYALPFGESVGFDASFSILAAVNLALLLPFVFLIWKGEEVRRWQGKPTDHADL
ncbi:MFS general substrate transporter [Lecanosticta acicola]|uniref:MFS general substrate transporter n=1 Tax=Lecanosticta acicola TaxID=111012 RepID=A0AAI8Z0I6_9PEZI|nr:MFS general substrate transporter [Lecanosticta acicola]